MTDRYYCKKHTKITNTYNYTSFCWEESMFICRIKYCDKRSLKSSFGVPYKVKLSHDLARNKHQHTFLCTKDFLVISKGNLVSRIKGFWKVKSDITCRTKVICPFCIYQCFYHSAFDS